jgi:hypothetical protein
MNRARRFICVSLSYPQIHEDASALSTSLTAIAPGLLAVPIAAPVAKGRRRRPVEDAEAVASDSEAVTPTGVAPPTMEELQKRFESDCQFLRTVILL